MDTVTFDGKEYTKASVLAEKFRYTQDYLGQLCRAKKVDARLVGRAWYVNLDSLMAHRENRYKVAIKIAEITPKKAINNYLSRIDVEPVLKQKTVKILKSNGNGTVSEIPMKYEVDDYALIPKIHREAVSVNLQIDQADAEILRVHKKNKEEINFEPEPLPEVYLHGTLTVKGLSEPMEEVKQEIQPKPVKPFERPAVSTIESRPIVRPKIVTVRPIRRSIPPLPAPTVNKIDPIPVRTVEIAKPVHSELSARVLPTVAAVPIPTRANVIPVSEALPAVQNPQFRPALIVAKEAATNPGPTLTPAGLFAPVSMVVTAFALGALIIATNMEILASGTSYDARFVVQTANLISAYDRLGL